EQRLGGLGFGSAGNHDGNQQSGHRAEQAANGAAEQSGGAGAAKEVLGVQNGQTDEGTETGSGPRPKAERGKTNGDGGESDDEKKLKKPGVPLLRAGSRIGDGSEAPRLGFGGRGLRKFG